MALEDPVAMPRAEELLACFAEELAKVAHPPASIGFRPGTVTDLLLSETENECCSGLAWVRIAAIYPSSTSFPLQDEEPLKTGVLRWAIDLEMGVARCAPTPGPTMLPTNAQWEEVVRNVMDDAAAMRRAVCCYIAMDPIPRKGIVLPHDWQPIETQGGCAGGTMLVTVPGPACDCSDAGGS